MAVQQQKEVLKQYYASTQLLVHCLSGCEVTPTVREKIEEKLLLPIAESEKRPNVSNIKSA